MGIRGIRIQITCLIEEIEIENVSSARRAKGTQGGRTEIAKN